MLVMANPSSLACRSKCYLFTCIWWISKQYSGWINARVSWWNNTWPVEIYCDLNCPVKPGTVFNERRGFCIMEVWYYSFSWSNISINLLLNWLRSSWSRYKSVHKLIVSSHCWWCPTLIRLCQSGILVAHPFVTTGFPCRFSGSDVFCILSSVVSVGGFLTKPYIIGYVS